VSRVTEQKLQDVAKWFYNHKSEISDPEKRTQFLEKAFDQMLWLLSFYLEDLQKLEGRDKIILPRSIRLHQDIRNAG
jgi:hypothetical protein